MLKMETTELSGHLIDDGGGGEGGEEATVTATSSSPVGGDAIHHAFVSDPSWMLRSSRVAFQRAKSPKTMLTFISPRTFSSIGDHLPLTRLSAASTIARLHRISTSPNPPLTLATLGFESNPPKTKPKPPKAPAFRNSSEPNINSAPFTAPTTAKSFSDLALSPPLLKHLHNENLTVPTDIQSSAIPVILSDRDVIIQSYTGSGKTLAYLLPILSRVIHSNPPPASDRRPGGIDAVIVAPSRELGMQIVRETEKLLGPSERRSVQQLVGGANRSRQEEALRKNKPSIVVGTPGRIAEISATGKLHTHGCRFLVLDEVDQLLAFNFREDMHRILEHVGRNGRRTIMVSATVPFSVVRAARSWGRDPLLVRANGVAPLESVPAPNTPTTAASGESLPPALKHYFCMAKAHRKVDVLRKCLHALEAKSVIVFMNHSKRLKDVVHKLEARGIGAVEMHGDLGKLARATTLRRFKNGEARVLVTNELSARGLDVAECDLVVNLDLPTDSVHYTHRAGRAGRLGRKGSVVTLCEEAEVFVVKKLRRQLGIEVPACEFSEGKLVVLKEEEQGTSVAAVA
ncbi:DEAD-box ATP-dependent RNA helicase 47A [Acorus gramineus]|uniref:RNA helicase n=1 Tax=Acorus gramineus TaxID=55184 RepID=A0AAV9ACU3_ACOGR|nr:DEAD-box ATP-dependent RNA helicase 47A [Acorus gramineus]